MEEILKIPKEEYDSLHILEKIRLIINLNGDDYSDGEIIDLIQEEIDKETL
jgi:hypothetical protein